MWVVQLGILVAADPLPLIADRKGKIREAQSYLLMQILTFSMNHLSTVIRQPNPYLLREGGGVLQSAELKLTSFFFFFWRQRGWGGGRESKALSLASLL